ncbi:CC0125/CC1285 family lipoprotein [Rheinheimera sp. UJ63]|uniref:CC0125/CC1285 family lipoprotein n=1 Tax=Rheinheimera sp. UJ63 TaxID=2910157 RepID=UPI001F2C7CF2|nr:hypothetical protein [Rheinheimera sp. UJ63]MCF4010773.1 hypothetical protein [Rheinheimera sp. UJ63]
MNKTISIILLALTLTACSSAPAYRAASGSGYGYAEQQISDNYYRVTFKARGDDKEAAKAYALRRAAELTAQQGYDWFVLVDKETLKERETAANNQLGVTYQRDIEQKCTLFGCRTRTVNRPSYEAGVGVGVSSSREHVEVALEVRMGKGVSPENQQVYPAKTL